MHMHTCVSPIYICIAGRQYKAGDMRQKYLSIFHDRVNSQLSVRSAAQPGNKQKRIVSRCGASERKCVFRFFIYVSCGNFTSKSNLCTVARFCPSGRPGEELRFARACVPDYLATWILRILCRRIVHVGPDRKNHVTRKFTLGDLGMQTPSLMFCMFYTFSVLNLLRGGA